MNAMYEWELKFKGLNRMKKKKTVIYWLGIFQGGFSPCAIQNRKKIRHLDYALQFYWLLDNKSLSIFVQKTSQMLQRSHKNSIFVLTLRFFMQMRKNPLLVIFGFVHHSPFPRWIFLCRWMRMVECSLCKHIEFSATRNVRKKNTLQTTVVQFLWRIHVFFSIDLFVHLIHLVLCIVIVRKWTNVFPKIKYSSRIADK
jgi:hypothetical protein